MTDLKRALRGFDDVAPDDMVFARARRGPTRPEPPAPRRRRGERIVAGVTALAVFTLATAFAWRVLRRTDDPRPPDEAAEVVDVGSDGSTLWPQRTRVELVSAQSRMDAGNGGSRWQLDPDEVLERFAESVLGWPLDTFRTSLDRSGKAAGTLQAHLERTEETCPPFTPDDEARGLGRCLPGVEEIRLVQPMTVGEGGVWVVAAVRSPDIGIDLVPGQVVRNGTSVRATVATGEELNAARVVVIGGYDGDRNCFRSSGADPELAGSDVEVSIDPDATSGTECGTSVHGYVVVSTATWNVAVSGSNVANPLNSDWSPYVSVEAVPIVVSIPENGPAPGMNVYEDPIGRWKVDLPEPWYVSPVNDIAGEWTLTISNDALPVEADTLQGPDPSTFPSDLVVLEITRLVGKPPHEVAEDDTTFPLDPELFRNLFQTTEAPVVAFQGNGLAYRARLFVGEDAADDVLASMLDVVRSLRFPSLAAGTVSNGWMSLGKVQDYPRDRGTPAFMQRWGVIYVVRGTGGAYVLDLHPDGCNEKGGNQAWDRIRQEILVGCPSIHDVRYERDGTPVAGNPPGFTRSLDVYPAITTWDGTILVSVSTTIDDVERYWPHA
jgi:hypothetical protein